MTDIPICEQCGEPHVTYWGGQACTGHGSGKAHPERKGRPCRQPPMHGQAICQKHGGTSPQALAAAEQRLAEQAAAGILHAFGAPVDVEPAEELLNLICHHAGYVRFLRTRVDRLNIDDMVWGRTKKKVGGDDRGTTSEAKPNIWIQMLAEWSDRHAKLVLEALKLNLDERRVRLAERQGEAMLRFLDAVLADLGHDPDDPQTAEIVERHLHLVAS